MIKKLCIVLFFCFGLNVWAQEIENIPNKNEEQAFLHVNTNVLVPGESLNYVFYNLLSSKHAISDLSKIAHVKLINSNAETIFSHIVNLKNGIGYSDYLIPSTLPSGTYNLVGHTTWMENFSEPGYFQVPVIILNPYQKEENNVFEFSESDFKGPAQNSENIKLDLNKSEFGLREMVQVQLNGLKNLDDYCLSISVRKIDSLIELELPKASELKKSNSSNFSFKNTPEYEGRLIKGKVENVQNSNLSVAIPGAPGQFRTYPLDVDGNFEISIPPSQQTEVAYLNVLSANENSELNFEFQNDNFQLTHFLSPKIQLNQNQKKSLKQRSLHAQIEQAYRESKKDSVLIVNPSKPIYGSRGIDYILDEFTRFPTMDETFVEIIQYTSFRGKANEHRINVFVYSTETNFGDAPLVLVDGLMTHDHEYIYNLDPKTINSIHIVRDKYFLGGATFQGIVDIKTFNTEISPALTFNQYALELQKTEPQKIYFSEKYTSENEKIRKNRIPDFRYQLLWLPKLTQPAFEFFTSDVKGVYEINIQGFQANGTAVSLSKTFKVD
ncbi:hypothetical protein [Gramella sp. AN32]|uniref:TonB-dependent receptor plug domain-containing protein n=1 Tax=Christiangramia antarctica TaxID=2058158 RepID=A0ABW5X664_9FLAO|nr:hypothetical protein [Gramella sp. AN32]MCM4156204.1 hypothetical protein [Gramella sp. AN32]